MGPDDEERPGCESDDEREPEELDDDEDAMPPDGYPEDEEAADGEAGEEDDEAEEAAAASGETGDSLSELGEEQRPAEVNAELTVEGVAKLKVPELKLQLKWRGLSQTGKKPELVTRLKEAVGQGWPVKATLPRSGRGRQASTGAAGSTGRPAANAARWKAPESIVRPKYEGSEKLLPTGSTRRGRSELDEEPVQGAFCTGIFSAHFRITFSGGRNRIRRRLRSLYGIPRRQHNSHIQQILEPAAHSSFEQGDGGRRPALLG